MKKLALNVVALATMVIVTGGTVAAQLAPMPQPASAAQQAFEAGQHAQALQLIAEARARGEAGPQDTFLAAQAQLRSGQNELARAEFAQLAALGDETWRLVAESSTALIDNNLDHALALATQAVAGIDARIAATPPDTPVDAAAQVNDFPALYQLGLVQAKREEWAAAAATFERAAAANPSFAYAYYYAGLAWSRVKQVDRVSANFERFLILAPKAPEQAAVMSIMRTIRGR